jgi:Cu-processing system permease protein
MTDDSRSDGGMSHAGTHNAEAQRETTNAVGTHSISGGHLGRIVAFAKREYRIVYRSQWPLGLAAAFALFAAGVVFFGTNEVGPTQASAVVVSLAELSVYLIPLAALALGHGTIVDADDRGSLEVLLSLPVPRADVVIGAAAGRAFAMAGSLLLGLAVGAVVFVQVGGGALLSMYVSYAVAAVALGVVFVALGVLVSTIAGQKSHALGGALLVWGWFVLVYDLLVLGVAVAVDLSTGALSALLLANPVDVFRLLVLSTSGAAYSGTTASIVVDSIGMPVLVGAMIAWLVVPVLLAGRLVNRRNV